jgi:hypothetical protein
MAWKVKEQYKDYKPLNMNLAYGELRPHQIENLSDEVKEKYFEQNAPKAKKKKNKVETNPYNEYTD